MLNRFLYDKIKDQIVPTYTNLKLFISFFSSFLRELEKPSCFLTVNMIKLLNINENEAGIIRLKVI